MDRIIDDFIASDATASLLAVPPQASFHIVEVGSGDRVTGSQAGLRSLRCGSTAATSSCAKGIFDVLGEGEDLVADAFGRLAEQGKLAAVRYDGFWAPMDTLKERSYLEELHRRGQSPWELWTRRPGEVA